MNTMDLPTVQWHKSSRSGHEGGHCVEIADLHPTIAVRDSKDPHGPTLAFNTTAWRTFTLQIKADQHDVS